jgi:hypothetical protein
METPLVSRPHGRLNPLSHDMRTLCAVQTQEFT